MGLTLLLGLLIAPMAQAQTGILGVVGDSISRATNADDDCSDAFECLENLGADWDFSFASGLQPWSLPQRLGAVGAVTAADDGARWDDALEQAQTVTARSGITDVIVTLGGNDACRKIGDPLPSYATLSNQMTGMLDHLVGTLPANGRITLVEVPDLLRLREVMADQPNVLFESCQGIWDLDGERLRPEAIEDVCDRVFGRLLCTTNDLTEAVKSLIASRLADERYVCENVLSSESTPAAREQAHTLTRQINHLIRQNARRRSGENGIDIRVADTVFKWDFEPQHVSKLDCFHPSRLGQEDLSTRVWEGMGSSSPLPQGLGVMTPSSGEFLLVDAYDTELRLTPAAPATGDQALSGDWNGDGLDGTGVYRPGSALFSLFSRLETGSVERRDVRFGPANTGWIALTGDWDGDGIDDPGLYNPDTSRFFLYREQAPALTFRFGQAQWAPVVGDWNGDGMDTIGVYNPVKQRYFLRDSNAPGPSDHVLRMVSSIGTNGSALAGDWDGDGLDGIGQFHAATGVFELRNVLVDGGAEQIVQLNATGAQNQAVAGRWLDP